MEKSLTLMSYEIAGLEWVAENFDVETEILQGFRSSLSALACFMSKHSKARKSFGKGA